MVAHPWVTIKDIPDQEAWFDKHGWPRFELPAAGEGQEPAGSEESPSDQRRLDAPPREARRKNYANRRLSPVSIPQHKRSRHTPRKINMLRRALICSMLLPTAFAFSIGCQGIRHPMMKGQSWGESSNGVLSLATESNSRQGELAIISDCLQATPGSSSTASQSTSPHDDSRRSGSSFCDAGPSGAKSTKVQVASGPAGQVAQASHTARHPSNCACCNSGK